MHIENVIFLILSKNAYTKFSEGPEGHIHACDLFQPLLAGKLFGQKRFSPAQSEKSRSGVLLTDLKGEDFVRFPSAA